MNGPRRSWLFVAGADEAAHQAAARSAADVLIQELEDFTPPDLRPKARAMAATLYERWRSAGKIAAVRVNPLESCGREDIAAVMKGRPDIVLMSKVSRPEQVKDVGAGFCGLPQARQADDSHRHAVARTPRSERTWRKRRRKRERER
jgi:citrate lyase beta subunit